MTVKIIRVVSFAEYVAMQDDAISRGWYRNDRRMFIPGMAWYQPWYYDPHGELAAWRLANPDRKDFRPKPMILVPPTNPDNREGEPGNFLSPHYWRDWASRRAPIEVVAPNGSTWEIDRWSSNGTGWTVTGELPDITCSPSIVLDAYPQYGIEAYHGFLRNGEFTDPL